MLVITRNPGERVTITGSDGLVVTLKVESGHGEQVRLVFHDPERHFRIWRSEVQERMEAGEPPPPRPPHEGGI
jgi:sRNA-binding carbon storage regulator CsrA